MARGFADKRRGCGIGHQVTSLTIFDKDGVGGAGDDGVHQPLVDFQIGNRATQQGTENAHGDAIDHQQSPLQMHIAREAKECSAA